MYKVQAIRNPFPIRKVLALLLLSSFLLIATLPARAQDVPPKPTPPTRVNDFAHVMTQRLGQSVRSAIAAGVRAAARPGSAASSSVSTADRVAVAMSGS